MKKAVRNGSNGSNDRWIEIGNVIGHEDSRLSENVFATGDLDTDAGQLHASAHDPHTPAVERADIAGEQGPGNADDARRQTENYIRHKHGERTEHARRAP